MTDPVTTTDEEDPPEEFETYPDTEPVPPKEDED